jgi:hypothetical protein
LHLWRLSIGNSTGLLAIGNSAGLLAFFGSKCRQKSKSKLRPRKKEIKGLERLPIAL